MTKSFSRTFMISAIVYFLLGLIFVIWPQQSRLVICYIAGGLFMLYGLIRILVQWNSRGFLTLGNGYLAGLLFLLLGLLFILRAQVILGILGTVLGLLVVADSVVKLQISYQLRRNHPGSARRNLICALITLVLGILMLFSPFTALTAMSIFTGICLMLDGIVDFCIALDVRRHLHDQVFLDEF